MYRMLWIKQNVEALLDIKGDVWLTLLTSVVLYRMLHGPLLNMSEAAIYSSAIGAFAYYKGARRP